MNTPYPATEWVQLVDEQDRPTGRAEKLDAHRQALLREGPNSTAGLLDA